MIRRPLFTVGVLAIATLALSGCGGGSGTPAGSPSTLELWMPPLAVDGSSDKEQWDEILIPFEEEHDVDVNVTIVDWGAYEAKFLTGISGGSGPDVGYMYNEMVGDYVSRDQLLPFDDYLTDEQKSSFLYLDNGKIDGVQYLMPFNVGGARVLYYNKDVLDAAGVEPPVTWDDFVEASLKINDAGFTAYVAPWGDPARGMMNAAFFPFLWQAGGDIFTEDASATAFNSKEGIAAATFVNSLLEKGVMPDSITGMAGNESDTAFASGNVGFYMSSDDTYNVFADAGVNLGVVDSLTGEQQGTFFNVDSLVMLKACEAPELCADLVSFMLSNDVQAQVRSFVPQQPISAGEPSESQQVFQDLYQQKPEILHALPIAANSVAVYNILYTNLQQMLLGQKTPEQAMEDAAKAGDLALKGE